VILLVSAPYRPAIPPIRSRAAAMSLNGPVQPSSAIPARRYSGTATMYPAAASALAIGPRWRRS
jgi:hypothetical protein